MVSFELSLDERKRRRAINVEIKSAKSQKQREVEIERAVPRLIRVFLLVTLVSGAAAFGLMMRAPWWIPAVYGAASMAAFFRYAEDKRAAGRGGRRVPELELHLNDFFCGWPGGLLAQIAYRHKTRKASFQTAFWMTVVLNLGAFVFAVWLLGLEARVR